MESRISKRKHVLLPRYFKQIGIVLMILAFVPIIIFRLMELQFLHTYKDLIKILLWDSIIVGLSFIAGSEDKVEDEMTIALRLKSIASAFGFTVLYVLINPVLDLFWKDRIDVITGQGLITMMLLLFLMSYYGQKKSR